MPERIFKRQIILVCCLIVWFVPNFALASHCTVSKLSIIAGSWENTSSKTSYTVQSQDDGGESCHVNETLRLSFESTEGGSFTSQTGNPIQAWISSNSANRNFYYENGTSADYILTIKAGYGTVDNWDVLFIATKDSSDDFDEDITTTPGIEETTTTNTTASNTSTNITSSVHYSSSPVTNISKASELLVGAGRDRLGSVGSPLEFKAEVNFDYTRNTIFKWNFGDGTERVGDVLNHTYEYPGEYVVVLNASLPQGQAVARVSVKIINPELLITTASPEKIEIRNDSKNEVNLFGRALVSGEKAFMFPQDTIIKPGQSISFSSRISGLTPLGPYGTSLLVIGEKRNQLDLAKEIEEQKAEKIAHLQNQISLLKQQMASVSAAVQTTKPNLAVKPPSEESVAEVSFEGLAAVEEIVEYVEPQAASAREGWLQILKHFFLRTR